MTIHEIPSRLIESEELWKHNTAISCWMGINGVVYDITEFLSKHPGGSGILLKYSGTDATTAFRSYHPSDMVDLLPANCAIGRFVAPKHVKTVKPAKVEMENIPLSHVLNSYDFARNARGRMSKEAWDYLVSGADDEVTYRSNEDAFNRIWLKPRVLRNVSGEIDLSVDFFGSKFSCPIFISATAMGRLYHPDGEMALTRGCVMGGHNVVQMCPTLASCSMEEMAGARHSAQTQWFQLYVNADRRITERIIKKAEALGMAALVITVDVAVLGKRERDQRNKLVSDISDIQKTTDSNADKSRGVSKSLSSFIHSGLDWSDLEWIRTLTSLPVLLKGIQTKEDALLAYESGLVQGIIVSNHGGRQVDFARPSIVCLEEIATALSPRIFDIYMDGGIRRGTDVLKALALGAKAVGIGRPAMFALASHGPEGVAHQLTILCEELRTAMMHVGCTKLSDIGLSGIIAKSSYSTDRRFEHESKL